MELARSVGARQAGVPTAVPHDTPVGITVATTPCVGLLLFGLDGKAVSFGDAQFFGSLRELI